MAHGANSAEAINSYTFRLILFFFHSSFDSIPHLFIFFQSKLIWIANENGVHIVDGVTCARSVKHACNKHTRAQPQ